MGTLTAKAYPTKLFLKAADHTYVECCGGTAWGCWGGKTGGSAIRSGTGSTKRADAIAGDKERAGIKCYLVNGVCHQAANRVLFPAGITVAGARGYSVSEALFGTYGRVGAWLCKSPFDRKEGVSGDLPGCGAGATPAALPRAHVARGSLEAKGEWQYLSGVLSIYGGARSMLAAKAVTPSDAEKVHLALFRHMAAFHLGPGFDKATERKLMAARKLAEKRQARAEKEFALGGRPAGRRGKATPAGRRGGGMASAGAEADVKRSALELAREVDATALEFQDAVATALKKPEPFRLLLGLDRDERVRLVDPAIMKVEYGVEIPDEW